MMAQLILIREQVVRDVSSSIREDSSPQRDEHKHYCLLMHMPSKHEAAEAASRDRLEEEGLCVWSPAQLDQLNLQMTYKLD